jgi:hypothetical protein
MISRFNTLLLLFILANLLSGVLSGAVVEQTYEFADPQIIRQGDTQIVNFGNSRQVGRAGQPTLPVQGIALWLPADQVATRLEIQFFGKKTISEKINLAPRQLPRNFSAAENGRFQKDEQVYTSTVPIDMPHGRLETHYLHGHPVALATFSPVSYIPATQTLAYFTRAVVRIETAPGRRTNLPPSFAPHVKADLLALVDNPVQVAAQFAVPASDADYDYLIITIDEFTDDYAPLAEYYNERGVHTKIATVEWIGREFSGQDTPEQIRNFIIDQYTHHSIQTVLLAGDADSKTGGEMQVPARGFYAEVQSSQLYKEYGIPSDLYYSALDGNWNADSDNLWGEPGEDDLLPELAVGRICADSSREIFNLIRKIKNYQSFPVAADISKVLMAGENLYTDPDTDGGDYLDLLIAGSNQNGYETSGMPAEFDFTLLYERNRPWNSKELLTEIKQGCNFLFHAGHSNESLVMKFSLSAITENNFKLVDGVTHLNPVIYSHGCLAAAIDRLNPGNLDCIAEEILALPNFAVAFVGNSRYGWFNEGQTEGPSAHLHREFVHALYRLEKTRLGEAHRLSRLRTAPFVTIPNEYEPGATRWTFYGCNVLGDPALDLWTDFADEFKNVAHADTVSNAEPILISTQVPDAWVTLSNKNGKYFSATTDASGLATFSVDSVSASPEWKLVVTKHNFVPFEARIFTQENQTQIGNFPEVAAPAKFSLSPGFPNPFNPETTFHFILTRSGKINLAVFNTAGQLIENIDSRDLAVGNYSIKWRAGNAIPSGIYFIRLENSEGILTQRVVLLK